MNKKGMTPHETLPPKDFKPEIPSKVEAYFTVVHSKGLLWKLKVVKIKNEKIISSWESEEDLREILLPRLTLMAMEETNPMGFL